MAFNFDPLVLIPGYGVYRQFKNAFDNIKTNGYSFGDFTKGWYGFREQQDVSPTAPQTILGEVINNSREEYLADREHTEAREDSAYQRGVEDMQKAGLNPYTIGANPSPSSASRVGENIIMAKLQALGYILDLKNLDLKNKQVANQAITGIIKAIK